MGYDLLSAMGYENLQADNFTLPAPCTEGSLGGECDRWMKVESVDIGRCSLHLPFGKESEPAALLRKMASLNNAPIQSEDLYLADSLLKGISDNLPQTPEKICKGIGCVYVKIVPRTDQSFWWMASNGQSLCLNVAANFSHSKAQIIENRKRKKWKCENEPLNIQLCGDITLSSDQRLVWNTRYLDTELNQGSCRADVIKEVPKTIAETLEGKDNLISAALDNALSSKFSFNDEQIAEFLPANAARDGVNWKALYKSFATVTKDCSNPAAFPGNVAHESQCPFSLFGAYKDKIYLPGRCVENPQNPKKGICHLESLLHRVETTPSGIELIIEDQAGRGYHHVIWELLSLLKDEFNLDVNTEPMLQALYVDACNAEPSKVSGWYRRDESSTRFFEQLYRLDREGILLLGPHFYQAAEAGFPAQDTEELR